MTDRQVLAMPIGRFWIMNRNITRLLAEMDMRSLTTFSAAQSAEGAKQHREYLIGEIGKTVENDPLAAEPEAGAFDTLRSLA